MEPNDRVPKGTGEFVDFQHSLERIKQKVPADSMILEEAEPALVKWKSKTEVK